MDERVLNMPTAARVGINEMAIDGEGAVRLSEPFGKPSTAAAQQKVVNRIAIEITNANYGQGGRYGGVEIIPIAGKGAIGRAKPVGHGAVAVAP